MAGARFQPAGDADQPLPDGFGRGAADDAAGPRLGNSVCRGLVRADAARRARRAPDPAGGRGRCRPGGRSLHVLRERPPPDRRLPRRRHRFRSSRPRPAHAAGRRLDRQRFMARYAKTVAARGAYRLYLLGHRRGVRPARLRHDRDPLFRGCSAGAAAAGGGGRPVHRARRDRPHRPAWRAGVHQHPGQPAAVPFQGHDPAADFLRRLVDHRAVPGRRVPAGNHPAQPVP